MVVSDNGTAPSTATRSGELGSAIMFPASDPSALVGGLFENHLEAYQSLRSNYEIALTGGKLETIICGIAAAVLPVNRVVYIRSANFGAENFSKGIGETHVYEFKSSGQVSVTLGDAARGKL
jgi:hypothetical protein